LWKQLIEYNDNEFNERRTNDDDGYFLSGYVTATLKSWSLYIRGYTTKSPPQSMDNQHRPAYSVTSATPCEEPGGVNPLTLTGILFVPHSLLITFCLVLWKAVVLTCS